MSIQKYHNLLPLVTDPELVAGTGEDKGGGEQIDVYSASYKIPLPFIPSSPRRRLYEPEATRGGEVSFRIDTS